jgi:hypothetical protein
MQQVYQIQTNMNSLDNEKAGEKVSIGYAVFTETPPSSNTAGIPPPSSAPSGTPSSTGGNMIAGSYYYIVTAISSTGETTMKAMTTPVTIPAGATAGSVALTWSPVTGASGYKLYRTTTNPSSTSSALLFPSLITPTPITSTSFTDTMITPASIRIAIKNDGSLTSQIQSIWLIDDTANTYTRHDVSESSQLYVTLPRESMPRGEVYVSPNSVISITLSPSNPSWYVQGHSYRVIVVTSRGTKVSSNISSATNLDAQLIISPTRVESNNKITAILIAKSGSIPLKNLTPIEPNTAAVPAPTNPPAATLVAGGSLPVGTYYYEYSIVTANGETTCSPETAALTTTSESRTIRLTLPSFPSYAVSYNIYRTEVNGPTGSEKLLKAGLTLPTFNDDGSLTIVSVSPPEVNTAVIDVPGIPTCVASNTGGSMAAGTYYYVLTALTANGETTMSPQSPGVTITSSTGSVRLSWTAITTATGYNIYRTTTSGSYGLSSYVTTIVSGSTTTYTDTSLSTKQGTPPQSFAAYPSSTVSGIVGPTPSSISYLPANSTAVFSWVVTLAAAQGQDVKFSAQVKGVDAYNNDHIVSSNYVTTLGGIQAPLSKTQTELVQKVDIFAAVANPMGSTSGDRYPPTLAITLVNPTDFNIKVYQVSIQAIIPTSGTVFGATPTAIRPTVGAWETESKNPNMLIWKYSTGVTIPAHSASDWVITVVPGSLGVQLFSMSINALTSMGMFSKVIYVSAQGATGSGVVAGAGIWYCDSGGNGKYFVFSNMPSPSANLGAIQPGESKTFYICLIETTNSKAISAEATLVINIPQGWSDVIASSDQAGGFWAAPKIFSLVDGSWQIIVSTTAALQGASKVFSFTATAPQTSSTIVAVSYILVSGVESSSLAWRVAPLAETVLQVAPPPLLSSPTSGATGVSTTPTFTWTAVAGASTYTLQYSTSKDFSGIVTTVGGLTGTTSPPTTPLSGLTTYYWRVKAIWTSGSSSYCDYWSFTTS